MPLMWFEYGVMAAMFAAILVAFVGLGFSFARVRMQKWVGGAIGNFMTNLAQQAAEEEGSGSGSPQSGVLNLGGFKIDVNTIGQLAKLADQFGLLDILKKGGSGGGGGW